MVVVSGGSGKLKLKFGACVLFSWKNVAHIIFNFELRPPAGCWRLPSSSPLRLLIVCYPQRGQSALKCGAQGARSCCQKKVEEKKQQIFRQLVKMFQFT